MITTRSPLRISLGGGGTDLPSYYREHGGFLIAGAINRYVYVNVMTSSLADGTCVTRYDSFLYTHATATLSYREKPVLVQVSLMHRGGISGGALSTHAATVVRGLQNYIDLFVTQIHDANK